jgi:hypothetical protein
MQLNRARKEKKRDDLGFYDEVLSILLDINEKRLLSLMRVGGVTLVSEWGLTGVVTPVGLLADLAH